MARELEVRRVSENEFEVPSSSHPGTVYRVRFRGMGDGEDVYLWSCDCPAGQHGRTCKHITAVGQFRAREEA